MFPVSKSAPLAFWAFIILSVSSVNVGINLKAIVIIIANSCAISFPIGLSSLSIPSVNSIGDVVRVNNEVPVIKNTNLKAINAAVLSPSKYILIKPNSNTNVSAVPFIINIFNAAVNIIKNKIGFNPLKINLTGILAFAIIAPKKEITKIYPTNLFIINKEAMNNIAIIIFVLGSNLCVNDSPGIYCPIVISFNIIPPP